MNIWVAIGVWIGACLVILSQTVEAKLKEGECEGKLRLSFSPYILTV